MEKGPPPGGYGLHPPPREVEEAKVDDLPASSPFRTPARMHAPVVRSKRWIGFPLLGLALVVVRMMFLFSRSEPHYDFDPGVLPTFEPLPTNVAPLVAPVTLGPMASDDRGTTYFVKNDKLWMQAGENTAELHFAGQGSIRDVAVGFRNVYVVDAVGIRRVSEFGVAETVVSGDFLAIALDGSDAFALTPTSIQKVNLAKGTVKTIASTDPDKEELALSRPLAVSNGFVWFGMTGGVGRVAKKTDHAIVDKPFSDISPAGLAPTPAGVLVASSRGAMVLGGKEPRSLTPEGWDSPCYDVVQAGKYVYVAYVDDGGWAVGRIAPNGDAVEAVVHTMIEPRLTSRGGTVLWSTPDGVRSAPEPSAAHPD